MDEVSAVGDEAVKVTFPRHGAFYLDLRKQIDAYFEGAPERSRLGHWSLPLKSALFLGSMVACYAVILSGRAGWGGDLLLAVGFGLASVFFVFNTAHDASHGTYSTRRWVNRVMSRSWNLVGISSYSWDLKHNLTHHTFTNVMDVDQDIEGGGVIRLHPGDSWRWYHRYQHIYALPLYSLISLITVYVQDIDWMLKRRWGNKDTPSHASGAWVELVFTKVFYVGYSLIVPLLVLSYAWWQVLIGYLVMHFVIGLVMTFILMTVHVFEGAHFVRADQDGKLERDWAEHQLATTMDVAPDNRIVHFFVGGLNTHVFHHLFPRISHAYSYDLTKVIRKTAAEHGVEYHHFGLIASIRTHLEALKELGRGPVLEAGVVV